MMKHNVKEWKRQLLLAGVLAATSPAVLSAGPGTHREPAVLSAGPGAHREPEVVRVTAPRVPAPSFQTAVEVDVKPLIKSIDAEIEKQHEALLESIGARRIELAISEVATRG